MKRSGTVRLMYAVGTFVPGALCMFLLRPLVPAGWLEEFAAAQVPTWLQATVWIGAAWAIGEVLAAVGWVLTFILGWMVGRVIRFFQKPSGSATEFSHDDLDAWAGKKGEMGIRAPLIYGLVSDYLRMLYFPFARRFLDDCSYLVEYLVLSEARDSTTGLLLVRSSFLAGLTTMCLISAICYMAIPTASGGVLRTLGISLLMITVALAIAMISAWRLARTSLFVACYTRLMESDPSFQKYVSDIMFRIRETEPVGSVDVSQSVPDVKPSQLAEPRSIVNPAVSA